MTDAASVRAAVESGADDVVAELIDCLRMHLSSHGISTFSFGTALRS